MAIIKTIPWDDGSGDNIYLDSNASEGNQTVTVSSDANTSTSDRAKIITFSTGEISETLSITQSGAFNPLTSYLTFEATEDSTIIRFYRYSNNSQITLRTIDYSLDNGETWTSYTARAVATGSTGGNMVTLNAGQKVMVRGSNSMYANSASANYHLRFYFSKKTYVYGNIMSLINKTDFANLTSFTSTTGHAFKGLFRGSSTISTHPTKDLILPVKTVTTNSYRMLFNGCSNISRIVCLATDISASNCTTDMTNGVSESGTFVKDSSMSSWTTGVNGIPSGWEVENYE